MVSTGIGSGRARRTNGLWGTNFTGGSSTRLPETHAASPLDADLFRSVAFRYFHPDAVISRDGTRLNGGRFVPMGVKPVYRCADEDTAMREGTARKKSLSGRNAN